MIHSLPEALVLSIIARLLMCKQKCKYLLVSGSGGTVWACTMVLNHLSRSPCSVLELNKRCLEVQLQSTGSSFGLSEAWDFLP